MKTLLLAMVEKLIAAILASDWSLLKDQVSALLDKDLPGEQKHAIVLERMRDFGSVFATWFLDIAIKMAYARLAGKALEETK